MLLQLSEVVERIRPRELTGDDEAHEEIADVGTVLGLVKETAFSVDDRLLQDTFDSVVVERSAGLTQKQRQPVPSWQGVADGLAETRVGLGLLVLQEGAQPLLELLLERNALALVQIESLLGTESQLLRLRSCARP